MRDLCETCPAPLHSYQCLDCRFNEDNCKMPDEEPEFPPYPDSFEAERNKHLLAVVGHSNKSDSAYDELLF